MSRTIAVYRSIDIDEVLDDAEAIALLGERDRARAARIEQPRRRREFFLGRMLLRVAITDRHGAGDWRIEREAGGRPYAVEGDRTVRAISLSHADGMYLCACAGDGRVGCDIERLRDRPAAATARLGPGRAHPVFSRAEREWIGERQDLRTVRFYALWTAKEATAKALGRSVFGMVALTVDVRTIPLDAVVPCRCSFTVGAADGSVGVAVQTTLEPAAVWSIASDSLSDRVICTDVPAAALAAAGRRST